MKDGERETDRTGPRSVFERLRAVELLAHVVCDRAVEVRFRIRKFVRHGVGDALREEGSAVELE